MSLVSRDEERLENLAGRLNDAECITAELLLDVMAHGCARLPALGEAVQTKLNDLIEAGACTEAAIALLEFELPQWKLRRLVRDDGEWFCSLSRQPALPIEYDQCAEATHPSLPVAILLA